MDNFLSPWHKPGIDEEKLLVGLKPETVLQMISVRDIGRRVPIEEVRKFSGDFAAMLEWFDRVGYNADIEGRADEVHIKPLPFPKWAEGANWS